MGSERHRVGMRAAIASVAASLGVLAREIVYTLVPLPDEVRRRPEPRTDLPSEFQPQGPPQIWLDYVASHDPVWFGDYDPTPLAYQQHADAGPTEPEAMSPTPPEPVAEAVPTRKGRRVLPRRRSRAGAVRQRERQAAEPPVFAGPKDREPPEEFTEVTSAPEQSAGPRRSSPRLRLVRRREQQAATPAVLGEPKDREPPEEFREVTLAPEQSAWSGRRSPRPRLVRIAKESAVEVAEPLPPTSALRRAHLAPAVPVHGLQSPLPTEVLPGRRAAPAAASPAQSPTATPMPRISHPPRTQSSGSAPTFTARPPRTATSFAGEIEGLGPDLWPALTDDTDTDSGAAVEDLTVELAGTVPRLWRQLELGQSDPTITQQRRR
jgi:hypothetical protein